MLKVKPAYCQKYVYTDEKTNKKVWGTVEREEEKNLYNRHTIAGLHQTIFGIEYCVSVLEVDKHHCRGANQGVFWGGGGGC